MIKQGKNKGFTIQEVLITVAIVIILLAVAFVAVINIRRSLKQTELDGIAKEIFVAAQNHLSANPATGTAGRPESEGSTTYYFVVASDYSDLRNGSDLSIMLPFASVDETVRLGGSYIIRYEKSTSTVLDVFYAEKSGTFKHSFDPGEYSDLLGKRDNGTSHKSERRTYGADKSVIGWYGGASAQALTNGAPLKEPVIEIINAERLQVKVRNENSGVSNAKLRLVVEGESSGKQISFDLNGSNPSNVSLNDNVYTVTLDSVTEAGMHFKEICGEGFTPGENLRVYAVAYNNTALTNVAYSATHYTNSLFADLTGDEAKISNIRHIENLDANISSLNVTVNKATQITDIAWSDFTSKIGGSSLTIRAISGATAADSFMPVNPAKISYDGTGHSITGIPVNTSGPAGLFGSLVTESEVKNLELIDFTVTSTSGSAGALAGSLNGCAVSGVTVRNGINGATQTGTGINGSTAAGGLVGQATSCTFTDSSASVYVASAGSAGGFAGTLSGGSVLGCYSGGHTENGMYSETDMNVTGAAAGGFAGVITGTSVGYSYSTCSAEGTAAAGGFAGQANGQISNCYATGLVIGEEGKAGSLVGDFSGTMTSCRYIELINDSLPAFAGDGSGTDVLNVDRNITEYKNFFNYNTQAYAYDDQLILYFKGVTNMPGVSQLYGYFGETAPAGVPETHYGDWPAPEDLVVNELED